MLSSKRVCPAASDVQVHSLSLPNQSLLMWSRSSGVKSWADHWWQSQQACLRQASIPFLLNRCQQSANYLTKAAHDPCAEVRAHVYKTLGERGLTHYLPLLKEALTENDMHCRFEAAASLYLLGDKTLDLTIILDLIFQLKGFTQRRAILLWASGSNTEVLNDWVNSHRNQPRHYRNILWAIAFRGECNNLSLLSDFLSDNIEPKLTAYIISHLTGLSIDNEGFWISIENENTEDDGLLMPDADKLIVWLDQNSGRFVHNKRYLNGQLLENVAEEIFTNGWQPQRWQAGVYLFHIEKRKHFSVLRQPFYGGLINAA